MNYRRFLMAGAGRNAILASVWSHAFAAAQANGLPLRVYKRPEPAASEVN
jgi:hypothetical protein